MTSYSQSSIPADPSHLPVVDRTLSVFGWTISSFNRTLLLINPPLVELPEWWSKPLIEALIKMSTGLLTALSNRGTICLEVCGS